jgi:hypothetical protein
MQRIDRPAAQSKTFVIAKTLDRFFTLLVTWPTERLQFALTKQQRIAVMFLRHDRQPSPARFCPAPNRTHTVEIGAVESSDVVATTHWNTIFDVRRRVSTSGSLLLDRHRSNPATTQRQSRNRTALVRIDATIGALNPMTNIGGSRVLTTRTRQVLKSSHKISIAHGFARVTF